MRPWRYSRCSWRSPWPLWVFSSLSAWGLLKVAWKIDKLGTARFLAGLAGEMGMFAKIRDFLAGKKTYLVCVAAVVTAVVAWSEGALTVPQLVEAIFAAIAGITIRAGVAKT